MHSRLSMLALNVNLLEALLEVVELVLKPVAFLRAASQSLCRWSGWDLPCRSQCKKAVKTKLVD